MLLPIKYRIAKHLTKEAFAKEVDVSVRMISRYEAEEYTNICIIGTAPIIYSGNGRCPYYLRV